MARPYILIKQDTLVEIVELHDKGVPISKLIRDFNLSVANPTLQRLISYLNLAIVTSENNQYKTTKIIHKSLFPAWLNDAVGVEVSQPQEWYYKGIMPLGEWLKR